MPQASNSFHTVAEQIISYNDNVVQILSNINSIVTTADPTVTLSVKDSNGVSTNVTLPSFTYLQNEINRLNNNINSLYGLNSNNATIQTSANSSKKIVTVDLNLEPKDISTLSVPKTFKAQKNYLFDALVDPQLYIELDMSGQVNSDVKEILARRYIIQFQVDAQGNYSDEAKAALLSFNTLFNGQSNIVMDDFLIWQQTTPGVLLPTQPEYIEDILPFEPNKLKYYGIFSVLKSEIDANNILWYYLDTLTYVDIDTNQPKQLAINDNLIINIDNSNTIYKITQVSNSSSNPKISLTRLTGNQPIPSGIATLKFYSSVIQNHNIKVPIGYNEYNIIFVKGLNTSNYLLSKNWSYGIGYYTNDLMLNSNDTFNGSSMDQYYKNEVNDYGMALKDLVTKIPVTKGVIPSAPLLDVNNFKVVHTNAHLTDNNDVKLLKQQSAQVSSLSTQANQLSSAIVSKNKQIQVTRFTSAADKQQYINDLNTLQDQYNSVIALKSSINSDILNSPAIKVQNVTPTYAVRGFWTIPAASLTASTIPQEIVKFDVQYKKIGKNGTEPPVQTFRLNDITVNPDAKNTAVYSNWTPLTTLSRKRSLNKETGEFTWVVDDQTDPNVININQLDIPILPGETVEIRMKSISEVGFPDSPIESDWSDTISIPFPDDLTSIPDAVATIISSAQKEDVKNNLMSSLNNNGLNDLLNQRVIINNTTYYLTSEKILSGYKDSNGNAIDLFSYLQDLTNTIATLQALVDNAQGKLSVSVFNNNTEYKIEKNSILNFTINCEDYLENISGNTVVNTTNNTVIDLLTTAQAATLNTAAMQSLPVGRIYSNNIYVVKDFSLNIKNSSTTNSLGLLSNVTYTSGVNNDIYNSAVPQVFWVDSQHNLITSDVTGQSKTQIDYQYIWSVNYDSVDQTSVTKLSDNIENLFTTNNNNSITNILSSTEYNVGYSDPSVLTFIGNNNSLLDSSKWIDVDSSVSSTNKLLTTIHPSVQNLTDIQETNSSKVHSLGINESLNIPLNIYFKMNALDPSKTGSNFQYINLNGVTQNIRHVKKLKFTLYNQADNTPFSFSIVFTINRVNTVQQKTLAKSPSQIAPALSSSFNNNAAII